MYLRAFRKPVLSVDGEGSEVRVAGLKNSRNAWQRSIKVVISCENRVSVDKSTVTGS